MHSIVTDGFAPIKGGARPSFWRRVGLWLSLHSERRALETLDRRMLADIGVEEYDALREARRAPWDVPDGRALRCDN